MFTRHFAHWPPGLPRSLERPRQTLYANLAASTGRHPDKAAIDYYGTRITYRELKRQVDLLAGYLEQRCRLAKGDRVLVDLQNSPQFVIAYYAVLRAGGVVVPVNPMNRAEELRHYAQDAGAAIAIVGQELFDRVAPLSLEHVIVASYSDFVGTSPDLPVPDFVRAPIRYTEGTAWHDAIDADLEPGAERAEVHDLAVLPYTSGTTGKPKGCMHTHATVQATTVPYLVWRGGGEEQVVLSAMPMFHVTGMQVGMNAPIYRGGTAVVLSRWDRDCAALQIERARVTTWSAITTMLVDFLSNPRLDTFDLSSLRTLGGGGAAMPEAFARRLEQTLGLAYIEGYGLTETMAPTHINPPHRPKRQCAGIPIFDTDSRIIDP